MVGTGTGLAEEVKARKGEGGEPRWAGQPSTVLRRAAHVPTVCLPLRSPNKQNEFQKKFWKLRQAEWEPYTLLYSPLRITQGEQGGSIAVWH